MQTRVYYNPYVATWTHARIDVNAALERATATTSKNLPYSETYMPLGLSWDPRALLASLISRLETAQHTYTAGGSIGP